MTTAPDSRILTADSVPKVWRMARLQFDAVRQRPVLLYPEGAVLLNDTGAAILELCDGSNTVSQIVKILSERYQADVTTDVAEYLTLMAERELIRAGGDPNHAAGGAHPQVPSALPLLLQSAGPDQSGERARDRGLEARVQRSQAARSSSAWPVGW